MNAEQGQSPAVDVGIAIAHALNRLYAPHFDMKSFDRLLRHPKSTELLGTGETWQEVTAGWREELENFRKRGKPYLLYQ